MRRAELLNATEATLRNANFVVSVRCTSRPSCFDFASRRGNLTLFIKVSKNVGCIPADCIQELRRVAAHFSASPLIVGFMGYRQRLEDDVVYTRHGVYAVSLKTLRDAVRYNVHPLIEAGPGGYYVRINGEALRRRREELGLSIGRLAELLSLSRITIYSYERGQAKASVSVAYKMNEVLKIPVALPINIFKGFKNVEFNYNDKAPLTSYIHRLIYKKLSQFNFFVDLVRKAPFDFIARFVEDDTKIVGGIVDDSENNLDRRVREILSLAEVVDASPLLITNGKCSLDEDVPQIDHKTLKSLESREKLVDLL